MCCVCEVAEVLQNCPIHLVGEFRDYAKGLLVKQTVLRPWHYEVQTDLQGGLRGDTGRACTYATAGQHVVRV